MRIAGKYSFNNGEEAIIQHYPGLLEEVTNFIKTVDSSVHKSKVSKEKTINIH
jgi:hypothetical protein